jgi:hypothetical protein
VRCALADRAEQLIGKTDGPLHAVYQAIVAAPQPYSAHNWLRSSTSAAILAEVAAGVLPLTHEALDAHPQTRAADFLRHMLVANGVLPARDDALVRLEAWVASRLGEVTSPEHRRVLRSYATWRVLRRARQRADIAQRPRTPTARAKTCLLAAIAFFDFLDKRQRTLTSCSQADIDTWLNEGPPSAHEIVDFIDWATEHKRLGNLVVPGRPSRTGTALDDDTRWALVERLLHDDNLNLANRVAGCLVLLYGQQLSRIVTLTRDQVNEHDGIIRLHLGVTHIDLPEPLGGLLARLAHSPHPYTGVGSPPATPWLFPGLDPGQPLTASYLGERLRRLGIGTMPGRRAALMHLAGRLPAAVLADVLNITPLTAVRWTRAAGGDWNAYAAQLIKDSEQR